MIAAPNACLQGIHSYYTMPPCITSLPKLFLTADLHTHDCAGTSCKMLACAFGAELLACSPSESYAMQHSYACLLGAALASKEPEQHSGMCKALITVLAAEELLHD